MTDVLRDPERYDPERRDPERRDLARRDLALGALSRMEPQIAVPVLIAAYRESDADLSDRRFHGYSPFDEEERAARMDRWFRFRLLAAIGVVGGSAASSFLGQEFARIDERESSLGAVLGWALDQADD